MLDRMRLSPLLLAALVPAAALTSSASAQVSVEGFDMGANPDNWVAWFSAYNSISMTGGNPGACLELDNFTSGPATCHFVDIAPDDDPGLAPHAHSGDWRAALVDKVSVDLDVQEGIFGGDVVLELVSDPGTPGFSGDDCIVRRTLAGAGPLAPGWETFSFDIASQQTTLPSGWDTDGVCSGDAAWNTVMTDMDQILIRYDGNPPAFCSFTSWILRVDNISVGSTGSNSLGTNYCSAVANSTGNAAAMSAAGSDLVSLNNVTLSCEQLPPGQFGLFVVSELQGFVPGAGGSLGNLCLSGTVGRYNVVQNSGTTGEVQFGIDLGAVPQGAVAVATMPGDTWNFTFWYRDVVGGAAASNFADGLSITFN